MLRRELKRLVQANQTFTLLDVRREAIRWVEEGQAGCDRSQQPSGRSADEAQYTSQCGVTYTPNSELAELKDIVSQQRAQIDTLVKHLGQSSHQASAPQTHRGGTFLRACVLVSGDVWQCTPLTSNASVTSCERLDGVHDGLM